MNWWPTTEELARKREMRPLFPSPSIVLSMARKRGFYYLQSKEVMRKTKNADALKRINTLSYISQDDFIFQAKTLLKSARLVYAYIADIDHAQHVYTKSTRHGLEVVINSLERIAEKLVPYAERAGWELITTSDHGQVSMRTNDMTLIGPNSRLMRDLSMQPWGTDSTVFFEVTETRQKSFEARFNRLFGKKFFLYESEEAIKAGLFGKKMVDRWLRYRFGTHVAISKGRYAMKYIKPGMQHTKFRVRGHHGGMTKEEMEVPLIII